MTDVHDILKERGDRYGNYLEQATISRKLVETIVSGLSGRGTGLLPDQEDALCMICVKLSRISNGDPDYADNWRDIAGYATLVADRLEGK
jgi:hypothetical protein